MSKAIIYCEKCGKIIPPSEADRGKAMVFEQVGVCPDCVASLSPAEREGLRRKLSGGPEPSPGAGRGRTTTARKPRAPQRAEGAPARRLAGRRSHKGVTVAVIAAGALACAAIALIGTSGSWKGPAKVPGGPPGAGAGGRSSPADPGGAARTEVATARRRLDEINSMIDPSLGRYREARAALLEFAEKYDSPPWPADAKALLDRIDADLGAMADEALEKAAESAEALASEGKFAEARKALEDIRERLVESQWFKERGEQAITGALGKIDAARVEAGKAAVARAGEALESKRFAEARAALEPRAAWPEGLRARADDLLKEVDVAEAGLGDQAKRKEAWTAFLLGFTDAGKLGLAKARAFLERERKALAKLGPDSDIERKLNRIERRFREAGLVEDLAEVGIRGSRGTVHFTLKGERVGGKVRKVEKGVVWLVTTRGRHVSVPIAQLAGADVVRYSGTMREGSKEKLRAATYLFLRGDPAAAREASRDATSDAAWALGDQIDEFAKVVEARDARRGAKAEAARAATEAAGAAAEAKAAAEADEKRKAEEAKRTAEAAAQGLVAHWKFDEGKGTVAKNSSGKGNRGAVMGARWTARGKLGGALDFDGVDDYMFVPRALPVDFSGPFTVSLWAKLDGVSWLDPLVGVTQDNNNYAFVLCIEGGLKLYTKAGGGWSGTDTDSTKVHPGVWYHFAAVMDANSWCAFYVNGARGKSSGIGQRNNRGILHIGRMANSGVWGEKLDGLIDDVRVYRRALSAKEVKFVFDGRPLVPGAPRKAEAGPPRAGAAVARTPAKPGSGAPQDNLVENGGFEEKDARRFAAGWTKEQWGARDAGSSIRLDRSNPHVGESALVLRGLAVGAKPGVSTAIRLDFGAYEIRYWVCTDVGKSATVGARFAGKDLPEHRAVDEWQQFTDTVTVEKRDLKLRLGFWVSTPKVRVWFDDVELVRK